MSDATPGDDSPTVPRWTRTPVKEAKRRPRWPETAAEYDKGEQMKGARNRRRDDPRPNAGYVVPADIDAPRTHAVECVRCALRKSLPYERDRERFQQVKYACVACRSQTLHNPAAAGPWSLIPFGSSRVATPAGEPGE